MEVFAREEKMLARGHRHTFKQGTLVVEEYVGNTVRRRFIRVCDCGETR